MLSLFISDSSFRNLTSLLSIASRTYRAKGSVTETVSIVNLLHANARGDAFTLGSLSSVANEPIAKNVTLVNFTCSNVHGYCLKEDDVAMSSTHSVQARLTLS